MPTSVFTDAYRSLIGRLVELRTQRQISQVELAKRLGKSQQFVSAVERRVRRLDAIELYAVLRALDVDAAAEVSAFYQTLPACIEI